MDTTLQFVNTSQGLQTTCGAGGFNDPDCEETFVEETSLVPRVLNVLSFNYLFLPDL